MIIVYKVVVIGLGNLGKRHVEALLGSELEMQIFCIDIVKITDLDFDSIQRNGYKEMFFYTDFKDVPKEVDLAIIATVSSVRRSVFEQLVERCNVRSIVFEKVLFPCLDDYEIVLKILNKRCINAWVNCGRRITDQYQNVRKILADEEFFKIFISGGRWGLLCNGIHMLDTVAYLAGNSDDLEIIDSELWSGLFESKRKGFYEAYGSLSGKVSRCRYFTIGCFDSAMPLEVLITSPNMRLIVCEGKQRIIIERGDNDWEKKEYSFILPYVSVAMTEVVEKILTEETCNLTCYEESMMIHKKYLTCLSKYFENSGFDKGNIPIT